MQQHIQSEPTKRDPSQLCRFDSEASFVAAGHIRPRPHTLVLDSSTDRTGRAGTVDLTADTLMFLPVHHERGRGRGKGDGYPLLRPHRFAESLMFPHSSFLIPHSSFTFTFEFLNRGNMFEGWVMEDSRLGRDDGAMRMGMGMGMGMGIGMSMDRFKAKKLVGYRLEERTQ